MADLIPLVLALLYIALRTGRARWVWVVLLPACMAAAAILVIESVAESPSGLYPAYSATCVIAVAATGAAMRATVSILRPEALAPR